KIDDLRRDLLGGNGQVALIFPVFVIDDDQDPAGAYLLHGLRNTHKWHILIVAQGYCVTLSGMNRTSKLALLALFSLLPAIAWPATIDPAHALQASDAAVARAVRSLHSPGVAVGIIREGKVILAKGYGVRRLGKTEPVNADTIFAVGSM